MASVDYEDSCWGGCGLVEGNVSLARDFKAKAKPRASHCFLPVDLDIEVSAPSPPPCLSACHHVLPMTMTGYTADTVNKF